MGANGVGVVSHLIRDRAAVKTKAPVVADVGMDVDEAYVKYQAEANEKLFLGYTLMGEGRYEDARTCLDEAVELRPSCVQTLYSLTCLSALLQDTKACSDNLVKAVNATVVKKKHIALQDTIIDFEGEKPLLDRPNVCPKWKMGSPQSSGGFRALQNFRTLQKDSKASRAVRNRINTGTWTSDDILHLVKGVKWVVQNTVYPESAERIAELYRCPWLEHSPLVVPNIRRSGDLAKKRPLIDGEGEAGDASATPTATAEAQHGRKHMTLPTATPLLPQVNDGQRGGLSTAPSAKHRSRTTHTRTHHSKASSRLTPAPCQARGVSSSPRTAPHQTPKERVRKTQASAKCKPLGLVTPLAVPAASPCTVASPTTPPSVGFPVGQPPAPANHDHYLPTIGRSAGASCGYGAYVQPTISRGAGAWTDTFGPGSTGKHFPLFNGRTPLRSLRTQLPVQANPVPLPSLTMAGQRKHSMPRPVSTRGKTPAAVR